MRSVTLNPDGRGLCASPLVLLVLALAAMACGSRSGLDCFGESCGVRDGVGGASSTGVGGTSTGMGAASGGDVDPTPPSEEPASDNPLSDDVGWCGADGTFYNSLEVNDAADLAVLEGCHTMAGSLRLQGIATPDLRVLRALQIVRGDLYLNVRGSLEGLESLTSVGNLVLDSLQVPSLAPLRNLREIGAGSVAGGILDIRNFVGIPDLTGLGGIATLRRLQVSEGGSLRSLAGLSVPETLSAVSVYASPALVSLSALGTLVEVGEIRLDGAGVANLEGFENLTRVDTLALVANPVLVDISQLRALRSARELYVWETGLASFAGLEALEGIDVVDVERNPSLVDMDALGAIGDLVELTVTDNPLLARLPVFESVGATGRVLVHRNASLESGPSYPDIDEIVLLSMVDNARLRQVTGYESLETARQIEILNNPVLDTVSFPALGSSRILEISCNVSLSESSLEPLAATALNVSIAGNQGSADPCLD